MLAQLSNPKTWAGAAGVFGIALILAGMMTQMDTTQDPKTKKCEPSPWNILTILIGCLLLIACFVGLKKPGHAGSKLGAMPSSGASDASVSPEPTPGSMMGDVGGMPAP